MLMLMLMLSRPSHRRAACRGAGPLPCCTSRPAPEDHAACASPRLTIDDQGRAGARRRADRGPAQAGKGRPEARRAGAPDLGSADARHSRKEKAPPGRGFRA